jgi:uncharacterized lipoprotein YddW (UPF0748 family)
MPESSQHDFKKSKLHHYIELKEMTDWRRYQPDALFKKIDDEIKKRLR